MTFPEEPIPVKVEIALDTGWADITDYVYKESIEIERGAADEATYTAPTKCTFLLNNKDGRFSPRNPNGPYYGQLKRNTPVLVSVETSPCFLDVPETGYAQTLTPPPAAGTVDLDIQIEFQSFNWMDIDDDGNLNTREVIGHAQFGTGGWVLRMFNNRPNFWWSPDWVSFTSLTSPDTPPVPPNGIIAWRVTLDASAGLLRYYYAPTMDDHWVLAGEQSAGGAITLPSHTAGLRIGDALASAGWLTMYGKVFRAKVAYDGEVIADVDFREQTDGSTSFNDSVGSAWTIGSGAHINNQWNRFRGLVTSWPARWTTGGHDAWVEMRAETHVRRLLQGNRGLESTLARRIVTDPRLVAYWPMEEPEGADSFYSPVPGVAPMTFTGDVTLGSHVGPPGSKDLPQLNTGARYKATTTGGTPGGWQVEFLVEFQQLTATHRVVATVWSTGTARQWRIAVNNATIRVLAWDRDDTELLDELVIISSSDWLNNWARIRLTAVQNGSDIDWVILVVPVGAIGGQASFTEPGQTIGRAYAVTTHEDGIHEDLAGMSMGHLAIFDTDVSSPFTNIFNRADTGFTGERADQRLRRLVEEEQGDRVMVVGSTLDTSKVGAQRPDRYVDLVRETATADRGIMTDNRDDARQESFKFIPRSALENQEPVLVLDYEGSDGLVTPMDPTDDDLYLRNDVTMERERGSQYRVTHETGANSIEEVGAYEGGEAVNVERDAQLQDVAGWELHLGTWDEERYPTIHLKFQAAPHKIPEWLRLEQGSVIKILNARSTDREWIPPGDLLLMVRGYVERLHNFTWEADLQCVPARPWDVTVIEALQNRAGHLGADEIELSEAIATSDTTLGTVAKNEQPTWTDNLEDYPFVTMIGGEGVIFEAPGNTVTPNGLTLTDATGFTAVNGTIAYTTDFLHPDVLSTGTILVTPNGSSATGGVLSGQTLSGVRVGRRFQAGCWVYAPNGLSDFRVIVSWYNSGGTLLSTETGAASVIPAGEWTWVSGTYTAPASAGRVAARAQHGGTPAAADAYHIWGLRASPATANLVEDSFTRSLTDSWGTTDSGHSWANSGGATADYDIVSTYGRHIHPSASVGHHSLVTGTVADADITASLTTGALSTGASQFCSVIQRYTDSSNLYDARVDFDTSNGITLTLRKRLAGSESVLGTWNTDWTHSAGAYVWVRFRVEGTSLKAKIWQDGKTEPHTWQIVATDTSFASGQIGVKTVRNAGNTNANADMRIGHFSMTDAQAIRVIRSWNYVEKSHAAGTTVDVLHEATLAI
jgi:hypothetical protein